MPTTHAAEIRAAKSKPTAAMSCAPSAAFCRVITRKARELYFRITLTQPRIVDLSKSGEGPADSEARETRQFVYCTITLEDVLGGTVAEDYWEIPVS